MTDCPHCRRLREENDELRETILQLQQTAHGDDLDPPAIWRLTPTEILLVRLLCVRPVVDFGAFERAMQAWKPTWEADPKYLDVYVCKLRQKLSPFGVRIRTRWATGFSLEDRARVANACRGGDPQVGEPTSGGVHRIWTEIERALSANPDGLTSTEIGGHARREIAVDNRSLASSLHYYTTMGRLERIALSRHRNGKTSFLYRLPSQAVAA